MTAVCRDRQRADIIGGNARDDDIVLPPRDRCHCGESRNGAVHTDRGGALRRQPAVNRPVGLVIIGASCVIEDRQVSCPTERPMLRVGPPAAHYSILAFSECLMAICRYSPSWVRRCPCMASRWAVASGTRFSEKCLAASSACLAASVSSLVICRMIADACSWSVIPVLLR